MAGVPYHAERNAYDHAAAEYAAVGVARAAGRAA